MSRNLNVLWKSGENTDNSVLDKRPMLMHELPIYGSRIQNFTRPQGFLTTRIVFGLAISVIIIVYTIFGFIVKMRFPEDGYGNPVIVFILMIFLGLIFLGTSLIYLKAYIEESRKHKKRKK